MTHALFKQIDLTAKLGQDGSSLQALNALRVIRETVAKHLVGAEAAEEHPLERPSWRSAPSPSIPVPSKTTCRRRTCDRSHWPRWTALERVPNRAILAANLFPDRVMPASAPTPRRDWPTSTPNYAELLSRSRTRCSAERRLRI